MGRTNSAQYKNPLVVSLSPAIVTKQKVAASANWDVSRRFLEIRKLKKQKGRVLPRPLRHILQMRTKFFSAAPPRTTVNTPLRYPIGCPLPVTSTGDTPRRDPGEPSAAFDFRGGIP